MPYTTLQNNGQWVGGCALCNKQCCQLFLKAKLLEMLTTKTLIVVFQGVFKVLKRIREKPHETQ